MNQEHRNIMMAEAEKSVRVTHMRRYITCTCDALDAFPRSLGITLPHVFTSSHFHAFMNILGNRASKILKETFLYIC